MAGEGESEAAYLKAIQDILNEEGTRVFLIVKPLGGGDPLALVDRAVEVMKRDARDRGAHAGRWAFLDSDRRDDDPTRTREAERLAVRADLTVVWQEPCFEGLLLRHFPGRDHNRPPDTAAASAAMLRQWPNYTKPPVAEALKEIVNSASLGRASLVEPALRRFLRSVGLV